MNMQIKGKNSLDPVTRACIGHEIARMLSPEGASVIMSGRDQVP